MERTARGSSTSHPLADLPGPTRAGKRVAERGAILGREGRIGRKARGRGGP